MRDDAVLGRALPLDRGLGPSYLLETESFCHSLNVLAAVIPLVG